uniref:Uncharacterized protein n=1 Tax=Kalanchoe fedtschenkoi TaxID=63787 RepID=A0A7N0TNE4_KALFE
MPTMMNDTLMWLQSYSGTNFNFPAYASDLQNSLSLSQTKLGYLTFSEDAGKILAFLAGVALQLLPMEIVLILGCMLGSSSFFVQYLYAAKIIQSPPPQFHSRIAGNNSSMNHQGVGLLICYQGLSAMIYSDLIGAHFPFMPGGSPDHSYLILNAALPFIVTVLALTLLANGGHEGDGDLEGYPFWVLFCLDISVGVCAVHGSIYPESPDPVVKFFVLNILLLVPLMLASRELCIKIYIHLFENRREQQIQLTASRTAHISIPIADDGDETKQHHRHGIKDANNDGNINSGDPGAEEVTNGPAMTIDVGNETRQYNSHGITDSDNDITSQNYDTEANEVTDGSAIMSPPIFFALYFAVYFCATAGSVFLSYLGEIAKSHSHSASDLRVLVSLAASANYFGRLVPSMLCCLPYFKRVSRPLSLASVMAPMAMAIFLGTINSLILLKVSTIVTGACAGAFTTISISTTRVLFGMENFNVNHNIVVTSIPFGSSLFGSIMSLLFPNQSAFVILGSSCLTGVGLSCIRHLCPATRN